MNLPFMLSVLLKSCIRSYKIECETLDDYIAVDLNLSERFFFFFVKQAPFGYTRKDVLLIGIGVTVFGIGLKSGLEVTWLLSLLLGVTPLCYMLATLSLRA